MEIERKYLIDTLPENLENYPQKKLNKAIYAHPPWCEYAARMRNIS